jgi:hypothetical protein
VVDPSLTLTGMPPQAFGYRLDNRGWPFPNVAAVIGNSPVALTHLPAVRLGANVYFFLAVRRMVVTDVGGPRFAFERRRLP